MGFWSRLFDRTEAPPAPLAPRCPWTTPAGERQCIRDQNHKGNCVTEIVRVDLQTGEREVTKQYWYGINYRTEEKGS